MEQEKISTMQPEDSFMNLFNRDPLCLLEYLYSTEKDKAIEEFNKIENNQSFFSRLFFSKNYSLGNASIKTFQFLLDMGFDFTKPINFYPNVLELDSRKPTYSSNEQNEKIFCDYLLFFNRFSSKQLIFLTDYLIEKDKEFIINLPSQGYYILHSAMSLGNLPVVEKLFELGLSPKQEDSFGRTVRDCAINNIEALKTYDVLMEKYYELDDAQKEINFQNSISWLKNAAGNIYRSSSGNYENRVKEYLEYLQINLPKYNQAQQEEMIATCLFSTEFNLLSKTLKLINKNTKNYDPQYYPLWKNLGENKSYQYVSYFLETKNISLDTHIMSTSNNNNQHDIEKNSFIFQLAEFLKTNGYANFSLFSTGQIKTSSGNEGAKERKIYSLLQDKINVDFLLSKDEISGETWFTNISNNTKLLNSFGNYLKYLSPHSPTEIYKEEKKNYHDYFQYLLANTFFDKNKDGQYNIQSIIKSRFYYIDEYFFFIKEENFVQDSQKPLYTTEQKNILFSLLLENELSSSYDWNSSSKLKNKIVAILENLKNDICMDWRNFEVSTGLEKSILDENLYPDRKSKNDLITEIKRIKSYYDLSFKIEDKDNSFNLKNKKNKI